MDLSWAVSDPDTSAIYETEAPFEKRNKVGDLFRLLCQKWNYQRF